MRLSTSLQKGILQTSVGNVLNRFIARSRRDTLFFEDILASYIAECEKCGYGEDIRKITERWSELLFCRLVPISLKRFPLPILTEIAKKNWNVLGMIDDLSIEKNDDMILIKTKNESITRIIGKNEFMLGFFKGNVNAVYDSQSEVAHVKQGKGSSEYHFELTNEPIFVLGRDKSLYDRLNYMKPLEGFTLNDAFKKGMLQLKDRNEIYFREKRITITENTIFHLIGNSDLPLDGLPSISFSFFSKVIMKESTDGQKLILLKNLLQVMGWGIVNISFGEKNRVTIGIKNPPYGLQLEKDNWQFLNKMILGYLWLLDEEFLIKDTQESHKDIIMTYMR